MVVGMAASVMGNGHFGETVVYELIGSIRHSP